MIDIMTGTMREMIDNEAEIVEEGMLETSESKVKVDRIAIDKGRENEVDLTLTITSRPSTEIQTLELKSSKLTKVVS